MDVNCTYRTYILYMDAHSYMYICVPVCLCMRVL